MKLIKKYWLFLVLGVVGYAYIDYKKKLKAQEEAANK